LLSIGSRVFGEAERVVDVVDCFVGFILDFTNGRKRVRIQLPT
jgi:hypothetical protein